MHNSSEPVLLPRCAVDLMKRSASGAFDVSSELRGDSKRPARVSGGEDGEDLAGASSGSSRMHPTAESTGAGPLADHTAHPEGAQVSSDAMLTTTPILPVSDGDAAAGPKPEADSWEIVPSPVRPVRLRRSSRISDDT